MLKAVLVALVLGTIGQREEAAMPTNGGFEDVVTPDRPEG